MRRPALPNVLAGKPALAVGAVFVLLGAVLAAVGLGWIGGGGDRRPADAIEARSAVTPSTSLFGDTIAVSVVVRLDDEVIDPASLRVSTDFKPYGLHGEPTRNESRAGGLTEVRFRYPLWCIVPGCAPNAGRSFALDAAEVTYSERSGARGSLSVRVPTFRVNSRLVGAESTRFHSGLQPFPPASYVVPPGLLTALLLLAALGLLVLAGALVVRLLPQRVPAPPAPVVEEEQLTPLQHAILLVRRAEERKDVPALRRALEGLARELRRHEQSGLAVDARRLAWSREWPQDGLVTSFTGQVEQEVETEHA